MYSLSATLIVEAKNIMDNLSIMWKDGITSDVTFLELDLVVNKIAQALLNPCRCHSIFIILSQHNI